MRWRSTVVLLFLALAAYGLVRFLGDPPAPPPAREPLVPDAILAELEEVELRLLSDQRIQLRREPGGRYHLRFGQDREGHHFVHADEVDEDRLEQLLQALQSSWMERLEGACTADDLVRFQLDPPRTQVVLRSAGQELSIDLGADDPTGQGVMARRSGEPGALRTGGQLASVLELNLDLWRSREVFPMDPLTVDRLELVWLDPNDAVEIVAAERDRTLGWQITAPRPLKAEPSRVQALAQKLCSLRLGRFLDETLTDTIRDATGLPDHWRLRLTLQAGQFSETLEVGREIDSLSVGARLLQRDENMTFELPLAELEPILDTTLDDLRQRRLTPMVSSSLVALSARSADGTPIYAARRKNSHPGGAWESEHPEQEVLHAGGGAHSFAQVVADLDRIEFLEFLDPQALASPFTPECSLTIQWKSGPILRDVTARLQKEADSVLVVSSDAPEEIVRAPLKLWEIAHLELPLYRARQILPPRQEFVERIQRWRFESRRSERVIDLGPRGQANHDPERLSARLTSAVGALFGAEAVDLVFLEAVPEALADPECEVRLWTEDVEYVLVIGREGAEGFHCGLSPGLSGRCLIIPRRLLEELLQLR